MPRFAVVLTIAVAAALATASCHREEARRRAHEDAQKKIADLKRQVEETEARRKTARKTRDSWAARAASSGTTAGETPDPSTRTSEPESLAPGAARGPVTWIVDEAADLGAGAPATATAFGVVANNREGDLAIAKVGALSHSPARGTTPLGALKGAEGPFSLGRGPGIFQDGVYWISHGSLVRRRLSPNGAPGPLEILARDARDGTRVAVPMPAPGRKLAKIPAAVAYVVRPEKEDALLVAQLWVEGAPTTPLTAEGNSTHSVSLVHTEDGLLVVSVQARMAMTPVHARRVRFVDDKPLLGDDLVAWVGGGIQPLTEMTLLPSGEQGLFGFIPHERSIKEFGIAELDLTMSPGMDTKATWLVYRNGIDPAPVAAGHVCGEPVLLYAQPETARPDSRQELDLRSLTDPSGKRMQRIASARAFYFVSIAELPGGALAVWVTDAGMQASTVRCTKAVK
jgi:hypothetical protein